MAGGYLKQEALTNDQTLILPSSAAIIAALGSTVGASSDFIYWNAGNKNVTITSGDGNTTIVGTISGTATVNNYLARFTVLITKLSGAGSVYVIRSSI